MKILFDIGANTGRYTFSNLNKYDVFVMVEPNMTLKDSLEEVKHRARAKNVYIENKAVTPNKEIDFYTCGFSPLISTCNLDWFKNSRFTKMVNDYKKLTVEGITIDGLVQKYGKPSHIKVDVEGYENVAIKTMTQKYCPISFEWAEECEIYYEILDYLKSLGYKRFEIEIDSDNYDHVPNYNISYEECYSWLKNNTDKNRKLKWGMIYAD